MWIKQRQQLTDSVFNISMFILYFRMKTRIRLVNSGVTIRSPSPKTRMSIFGSSMQNSLSVSSFMSSAEPTFHESTDLKKCIVLNKYYLKTIFLLLTLGIWPLVRLLAIHCLIETRIGCKNLS